MIWRWLDLDPEFARREEGAAVAGVGVLFEQHVWCVWEPDASGVWRLEATRALSDLPVIGILARRFPTVRKHFPWATQEVASA